MSKRINRQKLFLEFLQGKYEFRVISKYTDDYAYDAATNYGETSFLIPNCKIGLYEEITQSYIWEEPKYEGGYHLSFASFKSMEMKPTKEVKELCIQEKLILELFQDCKKNIKFFTMNDLRRSFDYFYLITLNNHDIKWSFNEEYNYGTSDSIIDFWTEEKINYYLQKYQSILSLNFIDNLTKYLDHNRVLKRYLSLARQTENIETDKLLTEIGLI